MRIIKSLIHVGTYIIVQYKNMSIAHELIISDTDIFSIEYICSKI